MKKISELDKNTLIVLENKYRSTIMSVNEINNYSIEDSKCYIAEKKNRGIDDDDIDNIIDYLSDNLYANDDLLEDDYLTVTEEEKEKLKEIFNNIINRTEDVYLYGEEIEIDI